MSDVPKLRFREFDNKWKAESLESLFPKIRNGFVGTATPYYTQNGVPYLQGKNVKDGQLDTEGLVTITKEFHEKKAKSRLKTGDIVLVQSGHVGECAVVPSDLDGSNCHALIILSPCKEVDTRFFVFYFYSPSGKRQIYQIKTGNTIEHVLASEMKSLVAYVPRFQEQQKIASFLSAVDEKISALQHRLELLQTYKRGVMQKLFSQEIRFKREDGSSFPDWEEKPLRQLANRQTAKNSDNALTRVLTNSAIQGVLDQRDYFDKDIANVNNLDGYYVVKEGDFVYNPRISVNAPVGPINKNKVGDGVMSPLYSVFRFKDDDSELYEQYFKSTFWHRYMHSVANYGARHDRMSIATADFMDMPLPVPHKDERTKITNFLSAIDSKIDAVNQQISLTEQFKKGLLQQMFV